MRSARASILVLLAGGLFAGICGQAMAGTAWIDLEASRGSDYAWAVKVRPSEGSFGRAAGEPGPCVLVATMWRSAPLEYHRSRYRQCGSTRELRGGGPPLVATGMRPAGGDSRPMSVVGMIFAPAVRGVRVTLGGGRRKAIRVRRIDSPQARRLGLGGFRYAAFAIRGTWCAEKIESLSATGRVLWDSGVDDYRCGAEGTPRFELPTEAPGS